MKHTAVAALLVSAILPFAWASSPRASLPATQSDENPPTPQAPGVECQVSVHIPMQSLERYAQHSVDVVRAVVSDVRNEPNAEGLPLTVYRAAIVESLKGVAADEVDVRVAGGVDQNGNRVIVGKAPQFAPGDHVVLFLTRAHEQDPFGVLGLSDGAYRVTFDSEGAEVLVGLHASNESPASFLERVLEAWLNSENR